MSQRYLVPLSEKAAAVLAVIQQHLPDGTLEKPFPHTVAEVKNVARHENFYRDTMNKLLGDAGAEPQGFILPTDKLKLQDLVSGLTNEGEDYFPLQNLIKIAADKAIAAGALTQAQLQATAAEVKQTVGQISAPTIDGHTI